ncbi:MAG: class A beta-lactamase-related serine hydrolase [Eubacteriales bacterium]|nr:class A beta-lactamase-related serine hydrolase [Eubacteriales bacterium]MDD4474704.1 class A beta-lactamase-related serine hydrolase [Eubacteriales bacterium]
MMKKLCGKSLALLLKKLASATLAVVIGFMTVSAATPSANYENLQSMQTTVQTVNTTLAERTKAQFSLMSFIEENNLSAEDFPETLPEKTLEALEKLCDSRPYAISFYYYDLTTGFTISYEADRTFRGASSIKMPYIAYVFDLIDNGKASFDDKIALKSSHIKNGTSEIRDKKFSYGTEFTVKQLVEYLMINSDNTAFAMLSETYSISSFVTWANGKYGTDFYRARNKNGVSVNSMTAASGGRMLRLIYERAAAGNEKYIWLLEIMKTANKNTFVKSGLSDNIAITWSSKVEPEWEVSHKYGMDVYASNDAAIVHYADRPYVLVILTDWVGTSSDRSWWNETEMRTVSYYIYQLHKYMVKLQS